MAGENEELLNSQKEAVPEQPTEVVVEKPKEHTFDFERPIEVPSESKSEGRTGEGAGVTVAQPNQAQPSVFPKSKALKEIEGLLAQNFSDIYKKLPPQVKQDFKQKGEEAAKKIEVMLMQPKIKHKSLLALIKDWLFALKKLPGINKFFLEQQAKIKADEVLRLKDERDKRFNP